LKTENREQIEFIQWFKRNCPGELIIHIPNGGSRNIVEATTLKAMGVMAGVPDLFIPGRSLWIEMKRAKGGRLSAEQKVLIDVLHSYNYTVKVCKGCAEAIEAVISHHHHT
tara:strand:- start:611 stop:943 length:333 start_codon:yes stop_codon:yes gene_type:complete